MSFMRNSFSDIKKHVLVTIAFNSIPMNVLSTYVQVCIYIGESLQTFVEVSRNFKRVHCFSTSLFSSGI